MIYTQSGTLGPHDPHHNAVFREPNEKTRKVNYSPSPTRITMLYSDSPTTEYEESQLFIKPTDT